MAATGYTPVYLYYSSTATNQPSAGNLGYGELAINITDGYLFYKDNANAVQKIGIKNPATTSGTLAQFASTTSAQLAGVISDETGSGSLVFATSPSLTTPNIGAATGTSLVTGNITYNTTGATSTGRLTLTPASGDYVLISGGTDDAYKLRIANDEVALVAGAYGTGSTYPREFVMTSARLDSGDLPYLRIGGQGGIKFAVDVNTVRATIFPSGGVSIGNTTDPGATNLSVTGSGLIQGLTVGLGAGAVSTNTTVGNAALATNSTGSKIAVFGYQALNVSTGSNVSAFGYQAGYNSTGGSNTYLGYQAGLNVTSGTLNTYVGSQAGGNSTASTGERNVGIGDRGLGNITSGSNNIGIGFTDSVNGYAPVFDPTTESNRIALGTVAVTNAYIKVAWTVTSDQRDKTNIVDLNKGLDFVNQLKPKQYQFKTNRKDDTPTGNVRYGFLAQDILLAEGSNPVIIDTEDEEHLKYNGESLVPVLVKAIQDLQSKLKAAGIAGF